MLATRTIIDQSAATDPSFANVSLLLHCDGANGSTTFTDSGPNALTVTANNATISTSNTMSGFGQVGYFNGSNSYLSLAAQSSLNFGTSNFTIEGWVYLLSKTNARQCFIASSQSSWSSGAVIIKAYDASSTPANRITFQCYDYSSSGSPLLYSTTVPAINTWYHLAITRSGNTFKMFVNGTQEATNTFTGSINFNAGNKTYLGYSSYDGAAGFLNGNLDEIRVTNAVARTISLPSGPFPNS